MHVLILDDAGGPSINHRCTYSSFLNEADDVTLSIITSKHGVSDTDREKCVCEEVDHIGSNGAMELLAASMHTTHHVSLIYTKQEDLILRASHLRAYLDIPGLLPPSALVFRDKVAMKLHLQHAVRVPPFARVYSPANVMAFIDTHGYPVIVKPSLGSASAGVDVLRGRPDLEAFCTHRFYGRIDHEGRCMDYSGDMIVEKFVPAEMYHVNGHARNSRITHVWPFVYINTNLTFTTGNAYGNVLIPTTDARYTSLVATTQRILAALPCPSDLVFHLELFKVDSEYLLCEIAARRPGGSIGSLIDVAESQDAGWFAKYEFRASIGLSTPSCCERANLIPCGDLLVPLQMGTLIKIPTSPCPVDGVEYKQIAKIGTVYAGFSINHMNTCARLIAKCKGKNADEVAGMLGKAKAWLDSELAYDGIVEQNSKIDNEGAAKPE
ncbi:hypothetical protein SeMB42_g00912 [Synchytrium endobioticum]|uniref:ATP-grasp domain-containing protein n=1 Tax=Synchytrium endobioticum TaxID=286115 RepID=A0A507DPT7_9FUNG|nr:hypothetical protein SeMB42_g00912 [Synchytrium endobioticum]